MLFGFGLVFMVVHFTVILNERWNDLVNGSIAAINQAIVRQHQHVGLSSCDME